MEAGRGAGLCRDREARTVKLQKFPALMSAGHSQSKGVKMPAFFPSEKNSGFYFVYKCEKEAVLR